MFALKLFLAGASTILWHWGLGVGIIILCLVAAWFSPVFKKGFLSIAVGVFLVLWGIGIGMHDETLRCDAKSQVITQGVDKIVAKTTTDSARKQKDRWDNPKY